MVLIAHGSNLRLVTVRMPSPGWFSIASDPPDSILEQTNANEGNKEPVFDGRPIVYIALRCYLGP